MKSINPIILSVLNQRLNLLNVIKLEEISLNINKEKLVDTDSYFKDSEDYNKYVSTVNSDPKELLKNIVIFFEEMTTVLKTKTPNEIKKSLELVEMAHVLYSTNQSLEIKEWNKVSERLDLIDNKILELSKQSEWVLLGFKHAVKLIISAEEREIRNNLIVPISVPFA